MLCAYFCVAEFTKKIGDFSLGLTVEISFLISWIERASKHVEWLSTRERKKYRKLLQVKNFYSTE